MKRLTMLLAFFVLTGAFLYAQGVQITGLVTGADEGTALPGVSVVVQGTTIGGGQRVADRVPQQRHQADDREHLHEDSQYALFSDEAAVKQGEAGNRHHQHDCGRDDHPGRVARVKLTFRPRCGRYRNQQGRQAGCQRLQYSALGIDTHRPAGCDPGADRFRHHHYPAMPR